jgi:hypothetical protein
MTVTPNSTTTLLTTKTFTALPAFNLNYALYAKVFNQQGDLTYQYSPLRNLQDVSGQLKYFTTEELEFDLNHPVDIQVQPSYDGTANLILNDNVNPPKLINTRFTPVQDNRYTIIDRNGNNDTNIYPETTIEQVTRLYKTTSKIPYVTFQGLVEGGALACGNYVFYFKYADADGNESDIVTESGIISCYVGKLNDPFSTRGGMANELTNKIAKFTLNNIDTSYDYLNIYFTRTTSDYNEQEIIEAYKIGTRKVIDSKTLLVTITGLEEVIPISVDLLNIQYNTVDAVKTAAQVQNRLFFGNVSKPTIPYKELTDLALRIYPMIENDNNIGYMDQNYNPLELISNLKQTEYNDAINVYKYTGFWNKEIYRLGVVFILKDDSLSPVFNIRGKDGITDFVRTGTFAQDIATSYTDSPLYDVSSNRQYIAYDDNGFIKDSKQPLENARGVVRIQYNDDIINKDGNVGVYPLSISLNVSTAVITEMQKYAKGFVFVRQKRIPTILCQAISIGVDNISYIPTIKAAVYKNSNVATTGYITESFVDKSTQLVHDFNSRLLVSTSGVSTGGFLCPEATLRSSLYNEIFTGALFNVSKAPFTPTQTNFAQDPLNNKHFYAASYTNNGASTYLYSDVKLTLIEDNQPLRYSGTKRFSTRVGIPEQAWLFSWFAQEDRGRYATNVLRGAWTGFVGAENFPEETCIVDIHIPGYNPAEMRDYFLLRANSFHPYYAMSDRYDFQLLSGIVPYSTVTLGTDNIQFQEYRGDCFIGNYTCRMMRNFTDPETPINDRIIDPLTWKTNYTGYTTSGGLEAKDIAKINRGDVNAVKMGHWVTFKLCSNINLAYRAIDETHSSEFALTGKARSFYPLNSMSTSGESKIPESTIVNVGYNSSTSSKVYIGQPDVPYIKNLFDNRIMFSEINVNDAFRNGYRVFEAINYKDITRQYGAVVKIIEWRGNLLCVFEHGVGLLSINERAMQSTSDGQSIFLKGAGVLPESVQPLSTEYGSTWKDSIIKTPNYVYGVDTIGKKIWRTNGQQFELISDFKMQKFLNDNITLGEAEKYVSIALRNVKSHYNAFKQDVMFTYYDSTRNDVETKWHLCFNEQLNKWITRYSWFPVESENIHNVWFSFDRESAKRMATIGYTLTSSPTSEGITLSSVNINNPAGNTVGTLSLKGYSYYSKYTTIYTIDGTTLDNSYFSITGNNLIFRGLGVGVTTYPKYYFNLYVRVGLNIVNADTSLSEVQYFYDYIGVKVDRTTLNTQTQALYDTYFSTWFWKHGQAGIFNIQTPILPTNWYGRQELFEFEFIVVDNPSIHKIFNNLMIISNDAQPDSFEFEVVGDSYTFKNTPSTYTNPAATYKTIIDGNVVHTYQKALDMKTSRRVLGNMQYKEDFWDVEIKPVLTHVTAPGVDVVKQTRIRDKYCRIRVRYSGNKLALITSLVTTYIQSYA